MNRSQRPTAIVPYHSNFFGGWRSCYKLWSCWILLKIFTVIILTWMFRTSVQCSPHLLPHQLKRSAPWILLSHGKVQILPRLIKPILLLLVCFSTPINKYLAWRHGSNFFSISNWRYSEYLWHSYSKSLNLIGEALNPLPWTHNSCSFLFYKVFFYTHYSMKNKLANVVKIFVNNHNRSFSWVFYFFYRLASVLS